MRKLLFIFISFWSCADAQVEKGIFHHTNPYIPVIVNIGQSNSIGLDEYTRLEGVFGYSAKPTGVKNFYQTFSANDGGWIDYISGDYTGMGPVVGKLLNDNLGTTVYILEMGVGGSGLATGSGGGYTWNPAEPGLCWTNFTTAWTKAKATLTNPSSLPIKVLAIVWHQGEADMVSSTNYNAYRTNFAAFVTALRAQDVLFATCPLIMNKLKWLAPGTAGQDTVNNVQSDFANVVGHNAYWIKPYDTSPYPWRQNEPAGILSTYPYLFYPDDNHASVYTQVNKANLVYNLLDSLGIIGAQKYPTSYTYDAATMDLLAYCTRNSVTAPSTNNIVALNTLIASLKTAGVWKKLRVMFVPANGASSTFASINIKAPDLWPIGFNNTTWTTKKGFKGNGTSQGFFTKSFRENYPNPNLLVAYSNTFNNMMMFELVDTIATKVAFGMKNDGTNDFFFAGTAGGSASAKAFGSSSASVSFTVGSKFFAVSRRFTTYPNVAPSFDAYVDATKTSVTTAVSGTTDIDISWGRDGVTPVNYGNETVAVCGYGEGLNQTEMDALRVACAAYKATSSTW